MIISYNTYIKENLDISKLYVFSQLFINIGINFYLFNKKILFFVTGTDKYNIDDSNIKKNKNIFIEEFNKLINNEMSKDLVIKNDKLYLYLIIEMSTIK
jgi:hypothetical protein